MGAAIWTNAGGGTASYAVAGNTYELSSNSVPFGNSADNNNARVRGYGALNGAIANGGTWPFQGSYFPGDSLQLDSNAEMRFKDAGLDVFSFPGVNGNPGLILNGGLLSTGDTANNDGAPSTTISYVINGLIEAVAGTTSYLCTGENDFGGIDTTRSLQINGQIVGAGTLVICQGGNTQTNVLITGTNTTFAGVWVDKAGWLAAGSSNALGTNSSIIIDPNYSLPGPAAQPGTDIANGPALFEPWYNINSSGTLTLANGGMMKLHQNCTFSAVTVQGTPLSQGSNSYSQLASLFPGNFASGGSGSITVTSAVVNSNPVISNQFSYAIVVAANQPAAYYQLNETNDPAAGNVTAVDSVGGYNGVYGTNVQNGNPKYDIPGPTPASGFPQFPSNNTAARFFHNQPGSQITLPAWNLATNAVTITAWIYPLGPEADGNGIVFDRSGTTVAGLTFNSTTLGNGYQPLGYNWNNDANTWGWNSGLAAPSNQWSFVALVVTPTNATIYVMNTNSAASSTHVYNHVTQAFDGTPLLGDDSYDGGTGSRTFDGTIGEVAVFNRSLSQSQVQGLYNSTLSGTNAAPSISSQPVSMTTPFGQPARFSVSASGFPPPLSYQWKAGATGSGTYTNLTDNGNITGSATPTLSIASAGNDNAADYIVVITNAAGATTSSVATLTVARMPLIVTQPVSETLFTGQTAQFSAGLEGEPPFSYQWRVEAAGSAIYSNLSDGGQISGSATSNLTISNLTLGNAGNYVLVVSNTFGSATSSVATLTIQQAPPQSTNLLQSALLKLMVEASPFSFEVIEISSGTVLLQQTTNQFTFGGGAYGVYYATNFVLTATTLDADLFFTGTSTSAHVTFNFIQPGLLQTTLSSSNNSPSEILQQFADQGEDIFGGFECPVGGTVSARGFSSQLAGCLQLAPYVNNSGGHAPFYLATRHYGIYAETPALGTLTFAQGGFTSFSFDTPQLTYDIIYGPDYATIMAGFKSRSGGSYMPPLWAFDSVWWKDDDHDNLPPGVTNAQGNVLDTANKLALYQIRASSEWIDRPYGSSCGQGDGGWGNMDWDTSSGGFNNPPVMVSNLQTQGINLMLWISDLCWCDLYTEGLADGYLFSTGDNTTADMQNPEAYNWFQTNLNNYVDLGIKGYKIDRGDQGEIPASVNNIDDTLFQQMAMNGIAAAQPNDLFVFARTVSDTGRAYSAMWNGDTYSTFPGLQYSVIAGLRAGILDFPMWGSDTGGYQSSPIPTEELFDRWLEFSAYSTIMEVLHGGGRTPWYNYSTNFTSPINIVAIAAAQAGAHHDLMPYSRSWLYQATQNGMPVMRPIMFGYPNDTNEAATVTNCEYLFGPNILVAPVITAGATNRNVYLPADNWLDYNTKTNLYTGPSNMTASAPIQTIPLFVNQDAIIPRGDIWQGNNDWTSNWSPQLRLEFFPSATCANSFPYYTGSATQPITCTNLNGVLTIQFGNLGLNGIMQVYLIDPGVVTRNGVKLSFGTDYTYSAASNMLQVSFSDATTVIVSNANSLFSPLTPIEAWRVAEFGNTGNPALAGNTANPAGDGIPNILKYAFGLNPLVAVSNGLPFGNIASASASNYLALTFQRATNATDCTYTVRGVQQLVPMAGQLHLFRLRLRSRHHQHHRGRPCFLQHRGDHYGSGKRSAQYRPRVLYAGFGVGSIIQRNNPARQADRKTNLHEKGRVIAQGQAVSVRRAPFCHLF